MHDHLIRLDKHVREDDGLRAILKETNVDPADVGAGLIVSTLYHGTSHIAVDTNAIYNASEPDPQSANAAAKHILERAYEDSLLLTLRKATNALNRRPGCETTLATELLGWIAANDEHNANHRYALVGTYPSDESMELAERVRSHKHVRPFQAGIGHVTYRNGYVFTPEDFDPKHKTLKALSEKERAVEARRVLD